MCLAMVPKRISKGPINEHPLRDRGWGGRTIKSTGRAADREKQGQEDGPVGRTQRAHDFDPRVEAQTDKGARQGYHDHCRGHQAGAVRLIFEIVGREKEHARHDVVGRSAWPPPPS